MAEGGKTLDEMVKAIEKNREYKVLSKAEYEALLTLAAKKDVSSEENAGAKKKNVDQKPGTPEKSSTPHKKMGEQEAHGPQLAHLSETATADMQMACNIFPILL